MQYLLYLKIKKVCGIYNTFDEEQCLDPRRSGSSGPMSVTDAISRQKKSEKRQGICRNLVAGGFARGFAREFAMATVFSCDLSEIFRVYKASNMPLLYKSFGPILQKKCSPEKSLGVSFPQCLTTIVVNQQLEQKWLKTIHIVTT